MTTITVIGRRHTETRAHTLLNQCTVTLVTDSRAPDKIVVAGAKYPDRESAEKDFVELAEELDDDGFIIAAPIQRFFHDWEADAIEEIAGLPHALTSITEETHDLLLPVVYLPAA